MNTESGNDRSHLLIVDDDRLILSTLSIGLEMAGYRISTSDSAEEAEALIAQGMRPELALIDIRMTGRDGIYLAEKLRERGQIPFMMLSAYGNPEYINQATRLGAVGYLLKPIDLPQLLPAIRTGLLLASELENIRQGIDRMAEIRGDHRSINLAVGIIMIHHRLNQPEAFSLLRETARSRRISLERLATEIILASEVISLTQRN